MSKNKSSPLPIAPSQNPSPLMSHLACWAFIVGAVGLVVGYGLIFSFAQRPDGDSTALALFEAQYGQGLRFRVADSLWFNGAGALFAWGSLYFFLDSLAAKPALGSSQQSQLWTPSCALAAKPALGSSQQSNKLWTPSCALTAKPALGSSQQSKLWTPACALTAKPALGSSQQSQLWTPSRRLMALFWLSLLMICSGWAWNQTRGWQGELYLEPGVEKLLGVDQKPTIMFERFLLPPAPDGAGRALLLRLLVEGQPYDIAALMPYKGASWTLTPRWYGAILKANGYLVQPLFFGASGASEGLLGDGRGVRVMVNVEALTVSSIPPLEEVELTHYAILYARFAPGDGLLKLGTVMLMMLLLYWLSQEALGIIKRN